MGQIHRPTGESFLPPNQNSFFYHSFGGNTKFSRSHFLWTITSSSASLSISDSLSLSCTTHDSSYTVIIEKEPNNTLNSDICTFTPKYNKPPTQYNLFRTHFFKPSTMFLKRLLTFAGEGIHSSLWPYSLPHLFQSFLPQTEEDRKKMCDFLLLRNP